MRSLVSKALSVVLGLSIAAGVAEAKVAPLKKRVKVEKSKSGIPFLKAEQVAMLPNNQRIQYVKYFRQAFRDIEAFQRVFDPNPYQPEKSASLPGERDIYAALFGKEANAQGSHDQGGQCQDKCIYTYHLNEYKKSNGCVRYPYGCTEPEQCKLGGGSKGLTCNFIVSGLQGQDGCIDYGSRARSTKACEDNRQRMLNNENNKRKIEKATNEAGEYFKLQHGLDYAAANLTDADLWSDDPAHQEKVQRLIQGLVDTMYSDKSYAQLLVITELYKRKGKTLPPVTVNGERNLEVQNLGNAFNSIQSSVDDIFAGWDNTCDQSLSAEVIASIRDEALFKRLRGTNKIAQQKRREYLAQESNPTNRNVLQKEECFLVDSRIGTMRDKVAEVITGLPVPPPVVQPDEKTYIRSIGCRTNTPREFSGIEHSAARCLACPLEKMVHHDSSVPGNSEYGMSNKWLSLMSTMGVACGYGTPAGEVFVGRLAELAQTFGHCSAETYEWNSDDEKIRARKFAKTNFWDRPMAKKERKFLFFKLKSKELPVPDVDDEFARIYGISYYEATALFCDPDNFDVDRNSAGYVEKIKRIKSLSGRAWSRDDSGRGRRVTLGRQRMEYALNNYRTEKVYGGVDAGELASCMSESLGRANRYFASNSRMCIDAGPLAENFAKADADSRAPQAIPPVIFAGADCWVLNQFESYVDKTTGQRKEASGYVESSDTGHIALTKRSDQNFGSPYSVACYSASGKCETRALDGATPGYNISYLNQAACHQASITMKQQKKEAKKNEEQK